MQQESRIARFSAAFVKNYRITTLLFLSILVLGFFSYTRFLKVEGFPPVEVPVVFVEATYFVNDADQVDQEITIPIESAAEEVVEITQVNSTTTPVGAFVVARFDENISSEKGSELLRHAVDKSVRVPEGASLEYRTVNAGSLDGKHDLIFNVSGEASLTKLQDIAEEVAVEVEKGSLVATADALNLIDERVHPVTGQTFQDQSGFNRVGYRDDNNKLVFENAISIGVIAKPDVGSVDLSADVRAEVDKYTESEALNGYTITYGGDLSGSVLDQKDSLEQNALIGLIAVILLIFLLIDWRASIVGGIFIPLVFAGVFLALYLIGYSLNVISLFALVLVLGIFVDNATVVIDAVERAKDEDHKGLDAIKRAISTVGTSVIAGTWTTILVFVPMMFISGVLGKFIILIPVTVITALIISLFLTLTIIPWLGNIFIHDKKESISKAKSSVNKVLTAPSRIVGKTSKYVAGFIGSYLKKGWKVFAMMLIALGLIGYGTSFAQKLDFSVFPPASDTDQIVITLDYDANTSVDHAADLAQEVEKKIEEAISGELLAVTYYQADDQTAMLVADLTEVGERETTSTEFAEQLQEDTRDFEGARVTVKGQSVGPPTEDFQIAVRVLGDTVGELDRGTKDVKEFLEGRELSDNERVTEVVIARFEVLSKIDGQRFAQVQAKISDPQKTNLVIELEEAISEHYDSERLKELELREGAIVVDLGVEGESVESFESATLALLVALIVMYGLLVMQFNSFTQPLLILLAIPFSFPVLFPALYITENSLSFFVMLGIIALAGVVVNNTIILVHQANLLRRNGKTAREAISEAIGIRFRALLATSLTTIAGLLPLAISDPFWEPLAYTIIFGLASSVVMAVFAFPAFYVAVEGLRDFGRRRRFGFKK